MDTIINLFELQVEQYPERIAVKSNQSQMTYKELNEFANHIAHHILADSQKTERAHTIALLFEHGTEMIAGILGVLKAGKAYVALDPEYPIERLGYILQDSGCQIVVTNDANALLVESLKQCGSNIEVINIDKMTKTELLKRNPGTLIDPANLCYIIYTSGSTGNPKGVEQNHLNIVYFTKVLTNQMTITPLDRIALFTSYSHQIAAIDIFAALLNGAAVYPYDVKREGSMERLAKWLEEEEISIYHSVPTVYRYLMETMLEKQKFLHIRLVMLSGETVYKKDMELYKKHFSDECKLVNLAGASEVYFTTTYFADKNTKLIGETVPIGYAAEGVVIDLLNEDGNPIEVNQIGEIIYKSRYISTGYWNMQEKTREVFQRDAVENDVLVFRSGDLGRLLPDNSIEFIGRKDFQGKVRGYRIELGEIEALLGEIEGIRSCAAAFVKKDNENYLVAYYVTTNSMQLRSGELKRILRKKLPHYMIPSCLVQLENMPLTPNGKVDRKNLPEPKTIAVQEDYAAPITDTEQKLAQIYEDILKIEFIGLNDNFFELGGHSLKAIVLASRVHKEFNMELSLSQIFATPTIKELALYLEHASNSIYQSISPAEEKEFYRASPAQKGMYILRQLEDANTSYNVTEAMVIIGKLDRDKVEEIFKQLIRRHEALRTSFEFAQGILVQKVHPEVEFNMEYSHAQEKDVPGIVRQFRKPFDLHSAPMVRVALLKVENDRHILVTDLHHIIIDSIATGVVCKEFAALLNGETLPEVKLQYKDFSEWHNEMLDGGMLTRQEEYWLSMFPDRIPVLEMPLDYKRPQVQTFSGARIKYTIPADLVRRMDNLARTSKSTLNAVTFCLFALLLNKYSKQEDMVIGVTTAGRTHSDIAGIVGMFANFLPIRTTIDIENTVVECLTNINHTLIQAYDCQDYPFDRIVEKLGKKVDRKRNPLFDTMLIFHNEFESVDNLHAKDLTFSSYEVENETAKLDFKIDMYISQKNGLECVLEYNTDLFMPESMHDLLQHFRLLIDKAIENPDRKVKDIEVITPAEQQRIEVKRKRASAAYKKQAKAYWEKYLEEYEGRADFPSYNRGTGKQCVLTKEHHFIIDKRDNAALKDMAVFYQVSVESLILAIWGTILQKYNNTLDVLFGLVSQEEARTSNRCIVPVRVKGKRADTLINLAKRIHQDQVAASEYSYISVSEAASPKWNDERISHSISFTEYLPSQQKENDGGEDVAKEKGLQVKILAGDELSVRFIYNRLVYSEDTIQAIEGNLLRGIQTVIHDPEILCMDMNILSELEKRELLFQFNDTIAAYPKHKTIHSVFEEQAEKTPHHIAAIFEDKKLTYLELDTAANHLAAILREKGVIPNSIVAIMVERSLEMLIGILGILKAGGAYLPIDPDYPEDRIKFMLEDSQAKIVLTQTDYVSHVEFDGITIPIENRIDLESKNRKIENVNSSSDLAYVIYTSGSTGKPKGVMIKHSAVINRLNWMQRKYPLTESDVILQKTPFTFDVSVWELFWWSFAGASVCFLKPGGEKIPDEMIDAIEEHKVTTLHFVPSMLAVFLEYVKNYTDLDRLTSLKRVFASGEALNVKQVQTFNNLLFSSNGTTLHNLYGPTEATVDVSYFDCSEGYETNIVPIGKPIDNIRLYILDHNLDLMPMGAIGELCIAGDGVAVGYLNRQLLTNEKFVNNVKLANERIYRTGDLARWLPDGNIEYMGRNDFQVKVRGNRIELGEIENQLLRIEGIREAIVLAKQDKDKNTYLCAYYVAEKAIQEAKLIEIVRQGLPDYMIPAHFIHLHSMPVTANGKLDRKALPEVDRQWRTNEERTMPRNPIETRLWQIWAEVLGIDIMSVEDNFFYLGGDSLKAIALANRINKTMGTNIKITDLYLHQSIEEMAAAIGER